MPGKHVLCSAASPLVIVRTLLAVKYCMMPNFCRKMCVSVVPACSMYELGCCTVCDFGHLLTFSAITNRCITTTVHGTLCWYFARFPDGVDVDQPCLRSSSCNGCLWGRAANVTQRSLESSISRRASILLLGKRHLANTQARAWRALSNKVRLASA